MDKNKVQFGLKMTHYAPFTETIGTDGTITVTYEVPKHFPGSVELTLDPQGDITPFYADDRVYYQDETNNGYEGTLTMAYHTDTVATDVFGNTLDTDTGLLVENVNDKGKQIALLFEFDGDQNQVRHVLYNVKLGRPTIKSQTKSENKDPITVEYPLKATAAADTGDIRAKIAKGQPAYATFFSEVKVRTPGV